MIQDIFEWLQTAGVKYENTSEQRQLGLDLIMEEWEELKQAITDDNKQEILDALVDLNWVCTNSLIFNNITLREFREYASRVSSSNWSKFCNSEMIAQMTVDAYAKGTHPDKPGVVIEAYYERVETVWVVKRKSDNKVLKSIYYKKP